MPAPRYATPLLAAVAVLSAACTFPAVQTSAPSAQPTREPTAAPSAQGAASDAPSASAPVDLGSIPNFGGREIVTTTFAGLRVRDLPGTDRRVISDLLPADSALAVVMGPIVEDELGWYLVTDADAGEPQFEEGWVGAGFEPDANLRSSGLLADDSPVIASLAQTGSAEFGPIEIPDERHIIRWAAVDPEGVRCQFSISLAAGAGEAVPAIRSTVGAELIPGTLQATFFIGQPNLRGQVFLTADTDCAWTLAVLREVPAATPAP